VVYLALASLAGELCTFSGDRHPKDLPGYEHRALGATFQGVHAVLSQLLLVTHATKATRIELEKREGGIWLGQIADSRLLEAGSQLFLGVKADIEEQRLQVEIPIKLKISSLDRIDFLIANALRGVPAGFVRVPPAALPVKTSFLYFQLDANHELWEGIKGAKNVAIFMPPEYPGLALELIGVRE
jgi:type VI secretion system protein ImpJ